MRPAFKLLLLASSVLAGGFASSAQSVDPQRDIVTVINDSVPDVTVEQPESLNRIVSFNANATAPVNGVVYRVEVYSGNNGIQAKENANARKRAIESRFPGMRGYVTFDSPYWICRVGDFTSQQSAQGALDDIRRAFPAYSSYLRVVRVRVNQSE